MKQLENIQFEDTVINAKLAELEQLMKKSVTKNEKSLSLNHTSQKSFSFTEWLSDNSAFYSRAIVKFAGKLFRRAIEKENFDLAKWILENLREPDIEKDFITYNINQFVAEKNINGLKHIITYIKRFYDKDYFGQCICFSFDNALKNNDTIIAQLMLNQVADDKKKLELIQEAFILGYSNDRLAISDWLLEQITDSKEKLELIAKVLIWRSLVKEFPL